MGLKYSPKNAIETFLKMAIHTLCIQNGLDPESAEKISSIGSNITVGGFEYEKKDLYLARDFIKLLIKLREKY